MHISMRTAFVGGLALLAGVAFLGFGDDSRGEIIFDNTPIPAVGAEGGPVRALDATETAQWLSGRRIFDRDWHMDEGLGTPDFNGDSCRACHQDPAIGGAGGLALNVFRYAQDNGDPAQFQNLPNGQVAHKLRPSLDGRDEAELAADVFEQRQTPSLFGIGLIDGISDATILANEDASDSNADGIFGVARQNAIASGGTEVGRFGWKAQIPRLADFLRDAMLGEIGITTPDDGRGFGTASDGDAIADPEMSQQEFDDAVFFMANLAAPPRGGSNDPAVAQGEMLFTQVGCATCHIPSLQGADGPVHLFSNLLLHNVMDTNFRGMSEPGAGVGVFRTPMLWGISKTGPYMHDGSAETLSDSIQAHAGEATAVTAAFNALTPAEQAALILFLEDL